MRQTVARFVCLSSQLEVWHGMLGRPETPRMRWASISTAILTVATSLGRRLEQAVMPNACVFCGANRGIDELSICMPCYDDLPWNGRACRRCANPLVADLRAGVACAACQLTPPPFAYASVPLLYEFPVDAAIKAMKFRRKLFYVPAFAELLVQAMDTMPDDVDALLPVPLHWRRQALRGFNQASELANFLGRKTGLPVLKNVVRHRATPYQSGLAAAHRQRNLRAVFAVRSVIQARHVLIIDDVVTTGETCRQLAVTLHDAGVNTVSVLAIARA
jgi:ComF family protein